MQHVPQNYTLEKAQQGYETLLSDLEKCGPSVQVSAQSSEMVFCLTTSFLKRAFYAKAYGFVNGGAGTCEVLPTYPDDSRSFRGIFFNNYGVRTMHPDSGFVSWNWGAPFEVGFNTINVNGRTCTCLCTSVLGQATLDKIRDQVEAEFRRIMSAAKE